MMYIVLFLPDLPNHFNSLAKIRIINCIQVVKCTPAISFHNHRNRFSKLQSHRLTSQASCISETSAYTRQETPKTTDTRTYSCHSLPFLQLVQEPLHALKIGVDPELCIGGYLTRILVFLHCLFNPAFQMAKAAGLTCNWIVKSVVCLVISAIILQCLFQKYISFVIFHLSTGSNFNFYYFFKTQNEFLSFFEFRVANANCTAYRINCFPHFCITPKGRAPMR